MECFRDIIDNLPYDIGERKFEIMLNCCAYCKKKNNDENFENKKLELIALPFFIINRNTNNENQNIMMKMMGMAIIDSLSKSFPPSKRLNNELKKLVEVNNNVAKGKDPNKYLNVFRKTSENSYLELLNMLLYDNNNKTALFISTSFAMANIGVSGHGFLHNFSYRTIIKNERSKIILKSEMSKFINNSISSEDIYLSLGRSLDEGMTQYLTDKASKSESNRYYIEVQFIKRLISSFGEEALINAYFNPNNNLEFFYNITKKTTRKCDFFDLLYYTDSQDWQQAAKILERISNNDDTSI